MEYDLAIVGGGPAACGAAVYAARKQLKTAVIAEEVGGQSSVSETIYNWIGTKAVSGTDLAKMLREHVEEYTEGKGTLTFAVGSRVTTITKRDGGFTLECSNDTTVQARAVLVATGSRHRKLDVPGAAELDNKGIMYCATCDGPLFSGMPVAVIGGGNAAFEAAIQLSQYADHVTLIHRNDNFRADPVTIEMVKKDPKVTIIANAELTSVKGTGLVDGLTYKTKGDETDHELAVSGIFVEIGQLPNTELVDGLAQRDELGRIVVDPYSQRTSITGIWAAGDCTDGRYHQNNIATGDAIKAIEDLYIWIKTGK
ncbi:MAG TPA: FAD-dependent oxidoreductase [Candidatus Paceibacterota bacterium]|nr:FAD-dependent oxidoreductase [Candidatus Paceibacterota bacterium]